MLNQKGPTINPYEIIINKRGPRANPYGTNGFFNWDSLHARLNSHHEAWSYKKKKHKKGYSIHEICLERTYS